MVVSVFIKTIASNKNIKTSCMLLIFIIYLNMPEAGIEPARSASPLQMIPGHPCLPFSSLWHLVTPHLVASLMRRNLRRLVLVFGARCSVPLFFWRRIGDRHTPLLFGGGINKTFRCLFMVLNPFPRFAIAFMGNIFTIHS